MSSVARPSNRGRSRPLSKQRLRLWLRLLRATRTVETEVRDRLRVHFAMTLPQFDVMAALARKSEGMVMTELSRTLMVSNGNVTGIVDRLAAEQYLLRHTAAEDRRSIVVRLTAKGAARFALVAAAHEKWMNELLSDFDAEEMEILIDHFDELAERIRAKGA